MLRRRFLRLTMATLIGAMIGKSRPSSEARRKDEPPASLTREQRLATKRSMTDGGAAARNRQPNRRIDRSHANRAGPCYPWQLTRS